MLSGERVRLILNPGSGTGDGADLKDQIIQALHSYAPAELDVKITAKGGDAVTWATEAADSGFEVVLAAGGDGTVTSVAHGVLQSDTRPVIGVIPLGTGNGLARVLGIPLDPVEAVEALADGKVVRLDALDVESHRATSLLFIGAGLDAEVNRDADSDEKSRLGFMAYIKATVANLAGRKNHRVRLVVDGQERNLRAHTVSLFNATRFPVLGANVGPDSQPHDGVAQMSVMTSPGVLPLIGQVLRIVSGPGSRQELEPVRRMELSASPPMLVHIDGDVIGETPVTAQVLPGALRFIAAASYEHPPQTGGEA